MKPTKTFFSNPTGSGRFTSVRYHVNIAPSKQHVIAHFRALPVQLIDKHTDADDTTLRNAARMLATSFPSEQYFRDNWRKHAEGERKVGVGKQGAAVRWSKGEPIAA